MAKYLPDGWCCSPGAAHRLTQMYAAVSLQVKLIASTYRHLSYPSQSDFQQEGMLAATYAIDTYTPNRGKVEAYIQIVVGNALAMVAAEVSAMIRAPKLIDEHGFKVSALVPFETIETPRRHDEAMRFSDIATVAAFDSMARREDAISRLQAKVKGRKRIENLKAQLLPDARLILELKMNTPLELSVLSRNLHGRNKLTNHALSRYTGMTLSRVEKSLKEIRAAARGSGLAAVC